ncbi:MOSC domain-containing protein [Nocardioides immobilis]|uniref:MOSC domain-containing protein n=1 Tax=Nocardioides immobilis TaxID=2049295 RepID=A0A417XZX9_9ACTN|nr:MOSC N-terminal beta barrel domain-containing protein [Nocardioides immobilis]RHW25901.1 MOSC domain-containing protein [Nocardioides immobilis]
MTEMVGRISELWRFPVKSMAGEQLSEAAFITRGLVGDRAYALVDVQTGKVVSAKSVKTFPGILECRAAFLEEPEVGAEKPPVQITFPDARSVTSDDADCDSVLSRFFDRKVTLSSVAPENFTIDQYHPDVPEADPAGHRDTVVETKLGSALFAEIGAPSPVPVGAFFDLFPVSVMSTSTLDKLRSLQPESRFEARRFRMNVIVDSDADGFVENDWIDRTLALGRGPRVQVTMPDPRCVMPTLAQDDLPRDSDVLRTLVRHNRLELEGEGRYPCAGVYGVVAATGTARTGESVVLV